MTAVIETMIANGVEVKIGGDVCVRQRWRHLEGDQCVGPSVVICYQHVGNGRLDRAVPVGKLSSWEDLFT